MKRIIYGIMLIFCLSFVSATVVTECQNLPSGNYELDQDFETTKDDCFGIQASNTVFDCKGHTISGANTYLYAIIDIQPNMEKDNISIVNCNIEDMGLGIFLSRTSNALFENITLTEVGVSGIYASGLSNSIFRNLIFDNGYGLYMWICNNNFLENIVSNNHFPSYGLNLEDSDSNEFHEITINDGTYILFSDNNVFWDSELGPITIAESYNNVFDMKDEVPEFGLIGSLIAIAGMGLIVYKKRN